jgi:hypothetical protein
VPKYVTLYNWTDQGVANAKDTVNRYQAAKQLVESKGGKIETILWTVGSALTTSSRLRTSPTMRRGRLSPCSSPQPATSARPRCAPSTKAR